MKVCHFTSVHRPEDIRIFHKECVSLAKAGHEVYLVQRGDSYDKQGVHIVGFGALPKGKIERITKTANNAYRIAKELDCDVYHFHDPELLQYGLKLKKDGKKVIFDSHEDVPAQIMDKDWIPTAIRSTVSSAYRRLETKVVKQIDAVIAATPHIAAKFEGRAKTIEVINNYPLLDDIQFHGKPFEERKPVICYAGGINESRGEKVMIEAMKDVDGELIIAGDHEKVKVGDKISYVGRIDRNEINELYGESVLGLCILMPTNNYYYSQPIKMYEYMAAGIPFICSNFPGWNAIAEESKAGICVDPGDVRELVNAINYLLDNRQDAFCMGQRGREYVEKRSNWEIEANRLLKLYSRLQE